MLRIDIAVGLGLVFAKSDYLQSHHSLEGLKLSRIFREHLSAKRMGWSDQGPLAVPPAWAERDHVGQKRIRRLELSVGDGLVVAREVGVQHCVSVRLGNDPSLVRVLRDLSKVARSSGPFPSQPDSSKTVTRLEAQGSDSSSGILRSLLAMFRR